VALREQIAQHGFRLDATRKCFGGMLEILVMTKQ